MRINLCLNCLETGAVSVEVGPTKGHQMDPYRDTVQLCVPCKVALEGGNFQELNKRYRDERTIYVGPQRED